MGDEDDVIVTMELKQGYEFEVDLHQAGVAPMRMDEPPPLGGGSGPNASRMLAAAVGHCLSASALFCLRKGRVPVSSMSTSVSMTMIRNERGRLRVGQLRVELRPTVAASDSARLQRCLELFEDFCVVTQSVRGGVGVDVEVSPMLVDSGEATAS